MTNWSYFLLLYKNKKFAKASNMLGVAVIVPDGLCLIFLSKLTVTLLSSVIYVLWTSLSLIEMT